MEYFNQIKLLLWKNYLLRKKHKVLLLVEFLWPIFMFMVLYFLRQIGDRKIIHDCHFKPKAMPVAGEMVFMQTFVCTLNNTCDHKANNATMKIFDRSMFSSVIKAAEKDFNLNVEGNEPVYKGLRRKNKNKSLVDHKTVTALKNSLDTKAEQETWLHDIETLENAWNSIRTIIEQRSKTFNDPSNSSWTSQDQSYKNWEQFQPNKRVYDEADNVRNIMKDGSMIKEIKRMNNSDLDDWEGIFNLNNTFGPEFIDYFFCGPDAPSLREYIKELREEDSMHPLDKRKNENKYEMDDPPWENDTSHFCNMFMRFMESDYETRILFRVFKPFMRGKVVYTPNAPVIKNIMGRVNESFGHVTTLIEYLKKLATPANKLRDIVNRYRDKDKFLKSFIQTDIGKRILESLRASSGVRESETEDDEQDIELLRQFLDKLNENIGKADSERPQDVELLLQFLECFDPQRIIEMPDENSAIQEAMKWLESERLWALVVFDVSKDAQELPEKLTYKIRTGIERTLNTQYILDRIYRAKVRRNPVGELKYITGGFAYIQNIVEAEIVREYTGHQMPGVYLKQTPYPCHVHDSFKESITRTFPIIMIVSCMFGFTILVKKIVLEKELHIKENMRVIGVKNSQHWIVWFIDAAVPMVMISFIMSVIMVKGQIIAYAHITGIWVFLLSFIFPTVGFAFLLSTLFDRASVAAAVSALIFFLTYLPYPPMSLQIEEIDPNIVIAMCLVSNIAFGLGCTWIANMEELALGVQLGVLDFVPVPDSPVTLLFMMQMLWLDGFIYMLLAFYIENVFPGGGNIGLPFYFFLTRSYWFGPRKLQSESSEQVPESSSKDPARFEAEPRGLVCGVSINELTKVYGFWSKKTAVNKLTLNFYEDQITSFLGHNGAGKSTSIAMMTGLLPSTSGTVHLYGVDIAKEPSAICKDIGICRQENVLLDELTVEEHLLLYGRLKNRSAKEVATEAKEMMQELFFANKANTTVKKLSGGMQRKLCVALAFIGGSRIVFLDEPTAGVDPYSRRSIWELLIKYKKGRTVILTTHFMDEADLLGDRIAIIAGGELVCCGSSVFLKNQLGKGYYLTIESAKRSQMTGRALTSGPLDKKNKGSAQVQEIEKLLTAIMPNAKFLEEIGSEIIFILPLQNDPSTFDKIFKALEENKKRLNIHSYGVSDTTLEEIFLKIAEDADFKQQEERARILAERTRLNEPSPAHPSTSRNIKRVTIAEPKGFDEDLPAVDETIKIGPGKVLVNQFTALLVKRFFYHVRNYRALMVEIVLPAAFIAIALYFSTLAPALRPMPPLTIDIEAYQPNNMFYSINEPGSARIQAYEAALLGPYGLGTKCVLYPEKCSLKNVSFENPSKEEEREDLTQCPCENGHYECSADSAKPDPPRGVMSTGSVLYNMTGRNISNWLIKTELAMSKYRFGGITLGYSTAMKVIGILDFMQLYDLEKIIEDIKALVPPRIEMLPVEAVVEIFRKHCNKEYGKKLFQDVDLKENIFVWYNNRGWIAGIAYMNAVSNLVLRALLPAGKNPSKYSITLINHPLPINKRQLEDQIDFQSNISLLRAITIIWALALIPATYSVYLVEERSCGFKHLQLVSGINRVMYWISNFIWDFIIYSVTVVFIIGIFLLYKETVYVGEHSIGPFIALLLAYGFVSITFVYPVSFLFYVPSNAFIAIGCYNFFLGILTLISTFMLDLVTTEKDPYYIRSIMQILPQFAFGQAVLNMAVEDVRVQTMSRFNVTSHPNYFEWDITLKHIIVMLCVGVFFFTLVILLQLRVFQLLCYDKRHIRKWRHYDSAITAEEYDDDVKRERDRVETEEAKRDGDILILNNLFKVYGKLKVPAVDRICVGIKRGECFGLLGLNGAGKTTVFKMLTGSETVSGGDATIAGFSIKDQTHRAKLVTGYCPQFDALDPYLTPREHLIFFTSIRGITGPQQKTIVDRTLNRLGLAAYKNRIVKSLSGGNKRKLNTAIALVNDPELVLLDEPTSGMDARARRFLWNCVQDCVKEGRCVVLTTHSMEECQALCTELAIMVNGRFMCFGTSQHLKHKFDEGYSLTIRCFTVESIDKVREHIEKQLTGSKLLEVHYLQMKFQLDPHISLGLAFKSLIQAKQDKIFQDYSISQTTLENIFLKFAKSQVVDVKTTQSSGNKYFFCDCHSLRGLCCAKYLREPASAEESVPLAAGSAPRPLLSTSPQKENQEAQLKKSKTPTKISTTPS